MIQGSKEWLEWRRSRVTSTDAAVLSGHSPFQTLEGLFEEKIGKKKPKKATEAMQRGIREEPKARALLEITLGVYEIEPRTFERERPFRAACSCDGVWYSGSADARDRSAGQLVEIKTPTSGAILDDLNRGRIPTHYMAQIQFQFYVSGIRKGLFCVFDGWRLHTHPVRPSARFLIPLIRRAKLFAKSLEAKKLYPIDQTPIAWHK